MIAIRKEVAVKRVSSLVLALAMFLFSTSVLASIPRLINYQGILLGSDEDPVAEGDYKITFKLYDGSDNLLWTEVHNQVFVAEGFFHVILGTVSPLGLPFDKPYFLGIQVGEDPELQPRMVLTSAAYAIRAEEADKLLGISVSNTPQPNKLLPLDSNGKFPESVIPAGPPPDWSYLEKGRPDTSSGNSSIPMLFISNEGDGDGISGWSTNGPGVSGRSDNNNGVAGWTGASDKSGLFGNSTNGKGVSGRSDNNDGTVGWTGASNKSGVYGHSTDGFGVTGHSDNDFGVQGFGTRGVYGDGSAYGVYGTSSSGGGVGVWGQSTDASGVVGHSVNAAGVAAWSTNGPALVANGLGNEDIIQAWSKSADIEFRVEIDGDVFADGTFHDTGADFADMVAVEGDVNRYEPGDVLTIGSDGLLVLSREPYATNVAGVYSTKPGFVGARDDNQPLERKIPLAMVGLVPVKVSAENGSIRPGDLLVNSSTPGHAMRAENPPPGTIVGKAMEPLRAGMGVISALVTLQ